ncbi:murein hydrolase activator EnvC [Lewinella sp. W8]|uniref:murein hydrolase activator EnvC family protein n=1 Tax=Lewinella sp. W8 TaxID=2528208 RepID=UPI00106850B1|nr:peptidoglycan DD-metalloendopeptidase family protein [Lewinella sp. W8]MTB52055.1 peptidoglycan DD-metalloendopeptidase family protein [Lewinella sp. W8]
MARVLLLLFIGLLAVGSLSAQESAASLRAKRQRLQQELKKTNRQLKATQARRGAAVGQANLLRQQIEQRTELLATLQEEANRNAARMRRDSNVIIALNDDLDRMADEYGTALRAANRARLSQGWLSFLLSAEGFNDAFRRIVYLRQYRAYRSRQSRLIRQTRGALADRLDQLAFQRIEQDSLLAAAIDQDETLREELSIQTNIVRQLSGSERALLAKVQEQQEREKRLQREIQRAIAAAVAQEEAAAREREKTEGTTGSTASTASSSVSSAGSNIAERRGRLGWPIRGPVARPFGNQPHPDVPSVRINNSGIDINVEPNRPVEAIFAGKVISDREVPGLGTVLMVRHGGYYTVYSNLSRASVPSGAEVQAGETIGYTAADGSDFHFELWKGKTPMNPARWLGK